MSDKLGARCLEGTPLVAAITSVCSMAFLLFGWDQGVMSGVIISDYWLAKMGNPTTIMVGTITALYCVGAVFGAILAAFTAEHLGRKRGLIAGAVLLIIGSVLMGACFERIMMIFGRIFTGLGIGYLTSVAPVYQSEICLPSQRGWQVSCQLTTLLFGLLLVYWVNYGLYFRDGDVQWRFPLLFQTVFCLYIIAVTVFLPETPRWLMHHEPDSGRGLKVLSKLRKLPEDDPTVRREASDIARVLRLEIEDGPVSWFKMLRPSNTQTNRRLYLALGAQFMQETAGINMITYYAPTLFQRSLGMTQERALFVGGFLQVWYLFASFLTWWMIDRFGRRNLFIVMAAGMGLVMACEAGCVAAGTKVASIFAVLLIFIFEGCFTWGWMAGTWVYPAEVLPLNVRARGAALAAAACFLGNFIVVEITPPALENIGHWTYVIFAFINIIQASICWALYPETGLIPLEEVDILFTANSAEAKRPKHGIKKLQWSIIPAATAAFQKAREQKRQSGQLLGVVEKAQNDAEVS